MTDVNEPAESLASLHWKQSAYVSRSAPSAPPARVVPRPAPDLCPAEPRPSSGRLLIGIFAATALALVIALSVRQEESARSAPLHPDAKSVSCSRSSFMSAPSGDGCVGATNVSRKRAGARTKNCVEVVHE